MSGEGTGAGPTSRSRARALLVSGVYLAGGVAVAGVVVLVALLLPETQRLVYGLVVGTPSLSWWLLVGGLATVVAARRLSGDWRRTVLVAVVGVTVLFAVVLGPAVGSAYASAELADRSDRETTALRSVPDTSTANARTRSESAAATAARAQVREPGFGTRDGRLTYRNGTYAWSFPVVPDELRSRLTGSQRGAVYVAADGSGAPVVRETPFRNGLGGVWLGAYEYQAMLAEPTLQRQPATRVVFEHDGEAYIAESTVRHEWRFRAFPVPQPYAVPQFAGVQLTNQSGVTEFVSASAVADDERLAGQAVYPPSLVRREIAALAYRDGLVDGALGGGRDTPRPSEFPGGSGEWPVAAPTGNASAPSLTYFMPTTAGGEGVEQLWAVDAQTGEAGVVSFRTPRIGPDRAARLVSQSDRVAGFGARTAGDPVPVSVEGSLHWQISTATADGAAGTGFVDAESGRTTVANASVASSVATNGSLGGDDTAGTTDAGVGAVDDERVAVGGEGDGVAVRVVVRDANGTVVSRRNVTVPPGGRVGLAVGETNNSTVEVVGSPSVDRPPVGTGVRQLGVSVTATVPRSVPVADWSLLPSLPSAISAASAKENVPSGWMRSV